MIFDYLRSAQSELKKVSWPSKQNTIRYTALVIGVSVLVAVFFTVLDRGLQAGVTGVLRGQRATTQTPAAPVTPTTNPLQGVNVTQEKVETEPATGTKTQPIK